MANKTLMDQFVAFAAPAQSNKPTDAVGIFLLKIDRQISFAEEARKGVKINTRSAWFRAEGQGYRLKIGREALKFGEHQWFAAASLDEVVERLRMAREVIQGSDALQAQIATLSKARSARMQGARKSRKTT